MQGQGRHEGATDFPEAPWYVVESDVKKHARLDCIAHPPSVIPYEDVTPEPMELPPRPEPEDYTRPPMESQTFIPAHHRALFKG